MFLARGTMAEEILDKKALAKYLRISVGSVTRMTLNGTGPKAYRIGGLIRFRLSDVNAWIDQHAVEPMEAA